MTDLRKAAESACDGWENDDVIGEMDGLMKALRQALAQPEQKKEWAGLTKDEVDSWELPDTPTVFEFARFIEAKLKEKNT
jgi:hypothetical protein